MEFDPACAVFELFLCLICLLTAKLEAIFHLDTSFERNNLSSLCEKVFYPLSFNVQLVLCHDGLISILKTKAKTHQ